MITAEKRPFKNVVHINSDGVTRPEAIVRNPNGVEKIPLKRDFKSLIQVGPSETLDDLGCTTRYVDTDGNELWHKNHGAPVRGVAIDEDGNTYEAGHEYRTITLRKRDPDGVQLWSRKHGADLYCCALCPDGIVVGGAAGTGGATVRKYAVDGTLSWSATTAAAVIEIAADSGGNVAALDSPADLWDRTVYAYAADGTLNGTMVHGGYSSSINYTWPSGLAFTGVPSANTGWFDDPFTLYTNWYHFRVDLPGQVTMNFGWEWQGPAGYPTAWYGSGLGDIFTHAVLVTQADFAPAFSAVHRSTIRGLRTGFGMYTRATDNGTYVNTRVVTGSEAWDDIGGGQGLCSQPGFIWTAGTSLRRYSEIVPHPASGRWWSEFPDWVVAHGNVIHSCEANTSNVSVLGGGIAVP